MLLYIIIILCLAYLVAYCWAATCKHKIDIQKDEYIRESILKLIPLNLSNKEKYEYLMSTYKSLEKSLPALENSASTIEQFAQIDRIKRNMKIILEECDKLKLKTI